MLVLAQTATSSMADDGLTNLNWLVQHNPIAPLSPSTPPASPSPLPYSSHSSSSSVSSVGESKCQNVSVPDYSRERIKPPYSYAQMITMAMESHGGRKVLLTDIYSWIRDNFAYFRGSDTSWQNSVRHNLSLNKQFVKVPRDPKDKGKGSYWKLDATSSNLPKDPYCLRRRNFTDAGSSRRIHRPEVSHPQVNPAIKTFLDRVRRLQEARRHPFAGTGETVEDIGAQECVYTDTEPLFDDFNRKLFKKDVEQYDPSGYWSLISACDNRKRDAKDVTLANLAPLTSMDVDGRPATDDQSTTQAKVRVEYNWEAYEYHPSSAGGAHLPLEPETVRLDLRIPTPEWWATNLTTTHNLLLSPSNANPMVKVFENLNSSGSSSGTSGIIIADISPSIMTVCATTASVISPTSQEQENAVSVSGPSDSRGGASSEGRVEADMAGDVGVAFRRKAPSGDDCGPASVTSQQTTKLTHAWIDNGAVSDSDGLLLDLDYSTGAKLAVN